MSGRAHLGLLGPPCPGGDRFPPEGVGINGVARGRGDRVTVTSSALARGPGLETWGLSHGFLCKAFFYRRIDRRGLFGSWAKRLRTVKNPLIALGGPCLLKGSTYAWNSYG